MATKANEKKAVWQAEGAHCGRLLANEEAPEFLKKQVAMSVKKHSNQKNWQSAAWMDGYLRVVGY